MEMFAGQLDAQLVGPGQQFTRYPDQKGSCRLRLPALLGGITTDQCHPAGRVIGQHGTLEQRGVGQEVIGFDMRQSHLPLGLLDPGLRGGTRAIGAMGLPRSSAARW